MQRGSSVRSHHNGGAAGTSRTCALSPQPSAESRSHMQSAASTDAASSKSIAAMASAWRRGFIRAKSECTAPGSACKKSRLDKRRRGVKPGSRMSDSGRGERTAWCPVSPLVAHGLNAGSRRSIPPMTQVSKSRPESPGLSAARGARVLRNQVFVWLRGPRRRGSASTTAGSRGSCGPDR